MLSPGCGSQHHDSGHGPKYYVAQIVGKSRQTGDDPPLRSIIGCATSYRQSQIYARSGVELHRSTLAGWVGKASFHLTPVVDRLAWHLKQSGQVVHG